MLAWEQAREGSGCEGPLGTSEHCGRNKTTHTHPSSTPQWELQQPRSRAAQFSLGRRPLGWGPGDEAVRTSRGLVHLTQLKNEVQQDRRSCPEGSGREKGLPGRKEGEEQTGSREVGNSSPRNGDTADVESKAGGFPSGCKGQGPQAGSACPVSGRAMQE